MDYPRTKLQIQVLDDSDDETYEQIAKQVSYWQAQGLDITHIQRNSRKEYKPGALAYGLRQAKGDFIAIFDADFVPQYDWLLQTLAHFYQPNTDNLGLVQTRWGHLNADDSILTMAQQGSGRGHALRRVVVGRDRPLPRMPIWPTGLS